MFPVDFLDSIAAFVGRSVLRKSMDGYCRLITSADERTLVADDGSLLSVFRLEGFRSMPGEDEMGKAVEDLRLAFSSQLGQPGYSLQFWFGQNPALGAADVGRTIDLAERVTADIRLDLKDLLDERRRLLPQRLTGERAYIALWSRPALLTRQETKTSVTQLRRDMKDMPPMRHAQWPGLGLDALITRHHAFAEGLVRELDSTGIEAEPLDVHSALSAIKGIVIPDFMIGGGEWKAVLPGDYVRARMPATADEIRKKDVSGLLWPLLARQIMSEHGEIVDHTTVQIGDTLLSGFDVTLGPEVVVAFNDLIRRILDTDQRIAWRVSMQIDSGGFQGQAFKEIYTGLLAFTAPIRNARIKSAFERLRNADGADDTVVRWRASFAAWTGKHDRETLQRHVATLRRTVERWGNCQTDALTGDPMQCVMSSTLALNAQSTAPAAAASLAEVLALAPVGRPASPWRQGAVMFRTRDGKIWPYQPGSAHQLGWVDIMVGTPGSGKSVLMNSINLGVALSRQSGRSHSNEGLLPRISIIDIGPSSSGLISLIRDALPVERRHEAVFHRLKMSDQYAVNPFDLQLCMRRPFEYERAFLINLICLICTPDGAEATYDGISALSGAVIDEAYACYGDDRSPKRYARSDSFEVDAVLDDLGFEADQVTTWFEIADYLFGKARFHEAALAQRFAVPTLPDLVNISSSETVREPFRDMRAPTGEEIVKAFQRMLTAACRDFPILARPTRFDVSNARIIAFDLAGVTARTGPQAKRQTAIMYMLARHALTADFWMDADELRARDLNTELRSWHLQRIENNRQMPKRLCFDEYHLTGGLGIRDQVAQDVRVGRKAGVQISLASQLLEDFDESVQKLASSFWFCNVPTEDSIRRIAATYNLSPSVMETMRGLRGPIEGEGAPVVAMLNLRSGTYIQHVFNQLGPVELWALSTTSEDTALRSMLYERLGSRPARQVLARRFPSGSAKSAIDRRLAELEDRGVAIDDRIRGNTIRELADELAGTLS